MPQITENNETLTLIILEIMLAKISKDRNQLQNYFSIKQEGQPYQHTVLIFNHSSLLWLT